MKLDRQGNITAHDVKRLLLRVYSDLRAGDISDARAYRESFILNNILKAIETTDLEERLHKIEGAMRGE